MNNLPHDVIRGIVSHLGTGDRARLSTCSVDLRGCAAREKDGRTRATVDVGKRVEVLLDFAKSVNGTRPVDREERIVRMGSHAASTGVRVGRWFGDACLTTENASGFLDDRYWRAMWIDDDGRDMAFVTAYERGAHVTFTKEIGVDEDWSSVYWVNRSLTSKLPALATIAFKDLMGENVTA